MSMLDATHFTAILSALLCGCLTVGAARGDLALVSDGEARAVIVADAPEPPPAGAPRRRGPTWDDQSAAKLLQSWIRKITDVELQVVESPVEGKASIFVGAAAQREGLALDDIESPSNEGLRVRADAERVLIAGQSGIATVKAAARFLEELGCRYFMDHPMGEVFPRSTSLAAPKLDITEKPGALFRSIWGSGWGGTTLWKIWNGAGGVALSTGHSWGRYVPRELFEEHPEYFALRDGERRQGDWYCTSNPRLRQVFAEGVKQSIRDGQTHASLSPPDGRGYCECDACRAQDDPESREPSTGTINKSNRYVDFYKTVATEVAKEFPDSLLNFYCYADYTQAPTSGIRLPGNLVAWLAPIRYCRVHRIGHAGCPSRVQLEDMIGGWKKAAQHIAYRTYNYNLAECLVPFSMLSIWSHDIPYLSQRGALAFNLESLANWRIYGPHMYLSIRLAYDPGADPQALIDDFYARFYGAEAGPLMRDYWTAVDRGFQELDCHTGSFYALHLVYTPEFVARCRTILDSAADAAEGNETYARRVAMHAGGFRNAEQYIELLQAINSGRIAHAAETYASLKERAEAANKERLGNHYTVGYLNRFLGKHLDAAVAATAEPAALVSVLPDVWRLEYEDEGRGEDKGLHTPALDDSGWREVATFSRPLNAQGLEDRRTFLWYRTRFQAPAEHGELTLFFFEIDGLASVYVNGRSAGEADPYKGRRAFEVDVSELVKPGENLVAVQVDHRNITELDLGGIIRPVYLIDKGAQPPAQ